MFTRSVWAADFNANYIAVGCSDCIVRFFLYHKDSSTCSLEDDVETWFSVDDNHHGKIIVISLFLDTRLAKMVASE